MHQVFSFSLSLLSQKLGIYLCDLQGGHYAVGDQQEAFSIQSIVKVLLLVFAITKVDYAEETIWTRVNILKTW